MAKRIKPPIQRMIGLDIDGVLRDFIGKLHAAFKETFPGRQVLPQVTYRLSPSFPDIEPKEFYEWFLSHPELTGDAAPYPGAVDFANELIKRGHRIMYVTKQPTAEHAAQVFLWLKKNGLPEAPVFVGNDKDLVDVDILLDDCPDNLTGVRFYRKYVCFSQPWNEEYQGNRVTSYQHFLEKYA